MKKVARALIPIAAMLAAMPAAAATLSGGYAGGNANDGVMFDLFARSAVTLESFDINADFGTFDYVVYYRAGGVGAALGDPTGWTEFGRFDALTTAGVGNATRLDFADLSLGAGLYGFYVTDTGAFSVNYSNSLTPSGSVQASSGALDLRVGYGNSYAFAGAVADRAFNGSVNFVEATAAVPEPATWGLMLLGFATLGAALRRSTRRTDRALRPVPTA